MPNGTATECAAAFCTSKSSLGLAVGKKATAVCLGGGEAALDPTPVLKRRTDSAELRGRRRGDFHWDRRNLTREEARALPVNLTKLHFF